MRKMMKHKIKHRIKHGIRQNRITPGKLLPAVLAAAALAVSACGSAGTELPDLSSLGDITVVTREEGSGTRSEFESLADTSGDGADEVALSTEQVFEIVGNDENAIGYLAYSAYLEYISGDASGDTSGDTSGNTSESTATALLSVDGIECSAETIADGDYPLEREYILACSGSLSDLENDFITYIRGAGQEIVAQTCTPVRETAVFLSGGYSGTITICGSSSMETLMEDLIEGYAAYNPNAVIELEISDSTEGLNAAMRGECDLAMSSRSLADYEEELLESYVIAADGIAVIVNSENPLTDISTERLKTIYDGDVTAWSELK